MAALQLLQAKGPVQDIFSGKSIAAFLANDSLAVVSIDVAGETLNVLNHDIEGEIFEVCVSGMEVKKYVFLQCFKGRVGENARYIAVCARQRKARQFHCWCGHKNGVHFYRKGALLEVSATRQSKVSVIEESTSLKLNIIFLTWN